MNQLYRVTSSLTKDMNAKADIIYRPNAIRALCRITDVSHILYSLTFLGIYDSRLINH